MDVDIDFPTNFDPLDIFTQGVRASRVFKGNLAKHPAGVYLQSMPKDKVTGFAAIPFRDAEEVGYFKVDFLHLSILDNFDSKEQIRALMKIDPDWTMLEDPEIVGQLFQLHRHADVVTRIKPRSVQELADCVAIIRPKKKHMVDAYIKARDAVRGPLYEREEGDKTSFKKSHAIAYALTIVIQLHLIKGKII